MRTIRQPQWHKAKWLYHCQTRRLSLDGFLGHDLVLNTRIEGYWIDSMIESFEVKDDNDEFVGIVFSVPNPIGRPIGYGERERNKFVWHAINTRYRMPLQPWVRSRRMAVNALIHREKEYWKRRRSKREAVPADDLDAIAAAFS